MLKKFLCVSIIFIMSILIFNISYATDTSLTTINSVNDSSTTEDNTIYSQDVNSVNSASTDEESDDTLYSEQSPVSTTSISDYEDSTELSVSNMINIVLIVVGVVLVFLGIAIIIKLN